MTRAWKDSLFVLSREHYDDLLDRIREGNEALSTLTSQSIALEQPRKERRQTALLEKIRQYASGAFNAIESSLQCACKSQHRTGLQLDAAKYQEICRGTASNTDGCIEVLHSKASSPQTMVPVWQEIVIEFHSVNDDGEPTTSYPSTVKGKRRVGFAPLISSRG